MRLRGYHSGNLADTVDVGDRLASLVDRVRRNLDQAQGGDCAWRLVFAAVGGRADSGSCWLERWSRGSAGFARDGLSPVGVA